MADGEPWRHSLCGGCCGGSCGQCMGAWACFPNLFSLITDRLDRFPLADRKELSTCNGAGWGVCGMSLCHLAWVPVYLRRAELRKRFNIKGNVCDDCCAAYCCFCCTLAQMDSELKDRAKLLEQYDEGTNKMVYAPAGGPPPPQGFSAQQGYAPQQQQMPPPGYPPMQQGYAQPPPQGMYYGPPQR